LSVNIKFICTSFRNRQNSEPSASFSGLFRSEYKWIVLDFLNSNYFGIKVDRLRECYFLYLVPASCDMRTVFYEFVILGLDSVVLTVYYVALLCYRYRRRKQNVIKMEAQKPQQTHWVSPHIRTSDPSYIASQSATLLHCFVSLFSFVKHVTTFNIFNCPILNFPPAICCCVIYIIWIFVWYKTRCK
jgi:hypothetical protein